ncbi:MAG: hypothetical protein HY783_02275 [Chloroflexi bacterium]|nr:hypothetical protein [Chloroflexota bacterium]
MDPVTFERQLRTPHSEVYYMSQHGERMGRVDLHYASEVVYGTIVVETDFSEEDVQQLIEQVDEDLVMTSDMPRDDFLVSVYRGKDLGFYSDDYFGEEEEGEEEEGEDEDDEKF